MKKLTALLVLAAALSLCGCPATTRGSSLIPPGEAGHAGSGILFPEQIIGFARGQIRAYDPSGLDVGVGYDLVNPTNAVAITVYVYPGPKLTSFGSPRDVIETARRKLTDNHFQQVKAEILRAHPQAALVSEQETTMQFQGQELYGHSVTFKSTERFAYRVQPVLSVAEVYAFNKWIIKLRATHPAATQDQAQQVIEDFKAEFSKANGRAPNQGIHGTQ